MPGAYVSPLFVSVAAREGAPASSELGMAFEDSSWTGLCKPLLCRLPTDLKALDQEERCGWPGTMVVGTALLCKKCAGSGPQIFIHQMPKVLTPQLEGSRGIRRQLLFSSLHGLFSVKAGIFYLPPAGLTQ